MSTKDQIKPLMADDRICFIHNQPEEELWPGTYICPSCYEDYHKELGIEEEWDLFIQRDNSK